MNDVGREKNISRKSRKNWVKGKSGKAKKISHVSLEESTLYLISAASGTGKTSLIHALLRTVPNIKLSISHTTRSPRVSELHGVDYYFISEAEFNKMVEQDEFLEYATVHGNSYGTSKAEIQRLLEQGVDVVLEIDWQGAEQIRQSLFRTVSVFILPPSREELVARISERKQDTEQVIKKRLKAADKEISHCRAYDFLIVNDDFEQALIELRAIVRANRCRRVVQMKKYKDLLAEFMIE